MDHDVLPLFGQIAIGEVDAADVQAWVAGLGARLSPSSVHWFLTILDQLLDAAVDADQTGLRRLKHKRPAHEVASRRFLPYIE